MKTDTKMHPLALTLTIFILFLILISSTGSATPLQNASYRDHLYMSQMPLVSLRLILLQTMLQPL